MPSLHPILDHVDGPSADTGPYRLRWYGLFVLCAALFIGQVDMTIVAMALSSIGPDLGADTSELQWVMDSYAITLAGFVLVGSGLADRYGRKGAFMAGVALFGVASAFGAFAPNVEVLIASRVTMGLGAALFFPTALSLIAVMFPKSERGAAIAVWSAFGGVGTVAGPILGGVLLDSFWWGAVLLVNVPVVIATFVGAAFLVPTSRRPGNPPLDGLGGALSVVALGLVVFAVIEGPGFGWTSSPIVAAFVLGAAATIGFVAWELRSSTPMLDVRVFRIPGVQAGAAAILVNLLTVTGVLFVVPLYLQSVRGESAITTALLLVPFGGLFGIVSFTAMPIARRIGIRIVVTTGVGMMALGLLVLAATATAGGLAGIVAGTAIYGAGGAWCMATATTVVLNSIPTSQAGDSAAVNQITRQVGAALGFAIIGTVLAVVYARDLDPTLGGLSSSDAATASASIDGADSVAATPGSAGDALIRAADAAFESGYRTSMLVGAAFAAAAAVFVAVRLRTPRSDTEPRPATDGG